MSGLTLLLMNGAELPIVDQRTAQRGALPRTFRQLVAATAAPFCDAACSAASTLGRRSAHGMAYYAIDNFTLDVAEMPTRNVVLTEYQAKLLERLVSSGRYQNASEVLREGLRLVEDQEAQAKARLKALRDAARVGISDAEAGRYRTFDSRAELKRHLGTLRDRVLSRKGRSESDG